MADTSINWNKEMEIQAEQAKTEQLSYEGNLSGGSNDDYVDDKESNSLDGQGSNYDLQPPFNTTDPWVYHDPVRHQREAVPRRLD